VATRLDHPAPEVSARAPIGDELCGGAKAIVKLAETRGWDTKTTYARGTSTDAQGTPTRVVDSLLVRMALPHGGNAKACAVWIDGKFALAYRWAPWMSAQKIKSTSLRAWLRGEG